MRPGSSVGHRSALRSPRSTVLSAWSAQPLRSVTGPARAAATARRASPGSGVTITSARTTISRPRTSHPTRRPPLAATRCAARSQAGCLPSTARTAPANAPASAASRAWCRPTRAAPTAAPAAPASTSTRPMASRNSDAAPRSRVGDLPAADTDTMSRHTTAPITVGSSLVDGHSAGPPVMSRPSIGTSAIAPSPPRTSVATRRRLTEPRPRARFRRAHARRPPQLRRWSGAGARRGLPPAPGR